VAINTAIYVMVQQFGYKLCYTSINLAFTSAYDDKFKMLNVARHLGLHQAVLFAKEHKKFLSSIFILKIFLS
jgi:hypothetical protein